MPVDNNNNNDDHNDDDESDWSLDDELDDNHYTSNDNYGHDHDDDCPLLNLWVPFRHVSLLIRPLQGPLSGF